LEKTMFQKAIATFAVAGMMAVGLMSAPAEAYHRHHGGRVVIFIGGGHYYGGHRHGHCHVYKVRHHGYWKKVKSCHRHRHGGGHHW
jgi:hypothetical protein